SDDPMRTGMSQTPAIEILTLGIVHVSQLPIDRIQVQAGRQWQREIASGLYGAVTEQVERTGFVGVFAQHETPGELRITPEFAALEHAVGRTGHRRSLFVRTSSKQTRKAVETVVPVVVPGDSHDYAITPVVPLAKDAIEGDDDAVVDLLGRRHRVGGVA